METSQEAGQELETANLSCDPESTVESGEKPDETDVTKLLQLTSGCATSDSEKPGEIDSWD
jgi:hypothetical protein